MRIPTTRNGLIALTSVLATALTLGACDSTEHVILLDIHAQGPVDELTVFMSSLGRPQPRVQYPGMDRGVPIPMEDRDLSVAPVRIAIEVGGPAEALVHVVGLLPDGTTAIATRCYDLNVESVIEDAVVLVGPLGALDADGDGFLPDPQAACREPDDEGGVRPCMPGDPYVCVDALVDDCNDDPAAGGAAMFPGAPVQCQDGVDDDCDDDIDEACGDGDGDTWEACAPGQTENCDCDDGDDTINPSAVEVCGDTRDQNCDGVDEFCDDDGDGFRADIDCDDTNDQIYPGAPEAPGGECDGVDNNCNTLIDEVPECADPDLDGDGVERCLPTETDPSTCDCNDCDTSVYGGGGSREVCFPRVAGMLGNGVDDDCDGMVDESCIAEDMDGDGVLTPRDCDDMDPYAFPQTGEWLERCGDGSDQNCVPGSEASACAGDTDGDGWAEPDACESGPDAANINPDQTETCNGRDDNCNGIVDELPFDFDRANFGCGRNAEGTGDLIDYSNRFDNCGGCRIFCDPDTANECAGGVCDCNTESSFTGACEAPGGTPFCCSDGCQDLANDVNNCGGCGKQCGIGESCVAGVCTCETVQGNPNGDSNTVQACPEAGGVGARDTNHCCGGGRSCVETRDNPNDCGACGFRCGPNSTCQGDSCQCDPPGASVEFRDCNLDRRVDPSNDGCEIDIRTNLDNCGACGDVCSLANANGTCSNGACRIDSCIAPFENCDLSQVNGCEANTQTDEGNCGTCGMVCNLNRVNVHECLGGTCTISTCDNNFGDCDGTDSNGCEVDFRSNNDHCGRCNNPCGANASCQSGACVCGGGRLNCDAAAGCETPFGTGNCGDCGVSCGPREGCNGSGQCTCDGTSAGSTAGGRRCTGGGNNQCCPGSGCQRLADAEPHCGACDTACGTGETCVSGACTCGPDNGGAGNGEVCDGGSPDCCPSNGGCTNLQNDFSNCGMCGRGCNSNRADNCSGGNCRCGTNPSCASGLTCCGGNCVNLQTDVNHCNGCGASCAPSEMCLSGSCGCGGGQRDCSGTCETPAPSSCGASCADCTAMAGAECCGASLADGSCVVTMGGDENNCGGCGVSCGGTCLSGSCCGDSAGEGCVSSGSCVAGTADNACGDDGLTCDVCGGGTPRCADTGGQRCVECNVGTQASDCGGGVCINHMCQTCNPATDAGCGGGTPECILAGTQCAVCDPLTDDGCSGGTPICLSDGSACVACVDDAGPGSTDTGCSDPTPACSGGTCVECEVNADCDLGGGEGCVSGENVCCAGCWDGSQCRAGTENNRCGSGGEMCQNCTGGESCMSQMCST